VKIMHDDAEVIASVGETLGTSGWELVDQARIDAFAEVTGDHQWIHVDPERAATGPFGGTIAHGYLTLSLLPTLVTQNYRFEGFRMSVNYGLDRVRFPKPVPVDSRVRATSVLLEATPTKDRGLQLTFRHTMELDGADDRPVCVADAISRIYF
jgi:acyl dehydratase